MLSQKSRDTCMRRLGRPRTRPGSQGATRRPNVFAGRRRSPKTGNFRKRPYTQCGYSQCVGDSPIKPARAAVRAMGRSKVRSQSASHRPSPWTANIALVKRAPQGRARPCMKSPCRWPSAGQVGDRESRKGPRSRAGKGAGERLAGRGQSGQGAGRGRAVEGLPGAGRAGMLRRHDPGNRCNGLHEMARERLANGGRQATLATARSRVSAGGQDRRDRVARRTRRMAA